MIALTTEQTISLLVVLVVGSGTGGIVGGLLTLKKIHLDKADSAGKHEVDLQAVDVEQFKALFPGGLGDAVEHWRDEAKALYVEVDQLRNQRSKDHEEIIELKSNLADTRLELARAKTRISKLETERRTSDE